MKLALLSFHTAANYGASLQAYALQKFLQDKGYDCEYINYVNDSRAREYSMSWHIIDSLRRGQWKSAVAYLLGSPFLNLRKYRFNKFYSQYLRKTEKIYRTSAEAEELNGRYDKFIVGSDQVWNPACNGDDAAFLLNFVHDDERRVSYSSSFGLAKIDEQRQSVYRDNLTRFASIAVREQIGVELVRQLTGREAKLVIDPVLLLSKEQWDSLLDGKHEAAPFVFSYTNQERQVQQFNALIHQSHFGNMRHYKLSRYTSPKDFLNPKVKVAYTMSPQDFLRYINEAQLVATASFHCTAMCILFNKPFVCFLTGDEGKDERLKTLLTTFGLLDRVYSERMTIEQVCAPIDYNEVNKLLILKRHESAAYLDEAISKIKVGGVISR